jgi:hypothetical protein
MNAYGSGREINAGGLPCSAIQYNPGVPFLKGRPKSDRAVAGQVVVQPPRLPFGGETPAPQLRTAAQNAIMQRPHADGCAVAG